MDLPFDEALCGEVEEYALHRAPPYDTLLVLGIGGSTLGIQALHQALKPWSKGDVRPFFLDNVDPEMTAEVYRQVDLKSALALVITKSGSTAETMAHFLILKEKMESALGKEEAKRRIVVVTDPEKGDLLAIAKREGYALFKVPSNVGGRFSVLSAVGLLPAALLGMSVKQLLQGAREAYPILTSPRLDKNPAAKSAAVLTQAYRKGASTLVVLPYSSKLSLMADWFRQLWGESLGKSWNQEGKKMVWGQTPVVSVGAVDQHSQVQLYMEGPEDKFYVFWRVRSFRTDMTVPEALGMEPAEKLLEGVPLSKLLDSELAGTRLALASRGRPSLTLDIDSLTPESLGELILLLEVQTALAGISLGLNPFDQPGVELGKRLSYALLRGEDPSTLLKGEESNGKGTVVETVAKRDTQAVVKREPESPKETPSKQRGEAESKAETKALKREDKPLVKETRVSPKEEAPVPRETRAVEPEKPYPLPYQMWHEPLNFLILTETSGKPPAFVRLQQGESRMEGKVEESHERSLWVHARSAQGLFRFSEPLDWVDDKGNPLGKVRLLLILKESFLPLDARRGLLEEMTADPIKRLERLLRLRGRVGVGNEEMGWNFPEGQNREELMKKEREGEFLVVSFNPPFLIGRKGLDSLRQTILQGVAKNEIHKGVRYGVKEDLLRDKIPGVSTRLFRMVVEMLISQGKVQCFSGRYFTTRGDVVSEEEELLLEKMEKILGRGGEKNFDINSISRELGIEARLVEKYIDLLMDKRKIVSSKGKEGGVFIHESLVENAKAALLKLKKRGKRFTVKDFREITGYTHQSAIPILELLDYMGLTRRVGDEREVLL